MEAAEPTMRSSNTRRLTPADLFDYVMDRLQVMDIEDIDWFYVLTNHDLPLAFIILHLKPSDKVELLKNHKFDEVTLDKYIGVVFDPNDVICYQDLSEDFVESHLDKFELIDVFKCLTLSEGFIERNEYNPNLYIDWDSDDSQMILFRYYNEVHNIIEQEILSGETIPGIDGNAHIRTHMKFQSKLYWSYATRFQQLNEPFIEKHIDKFDLQCVLAFQRLTEPFMEKYSDRFDWYHMPMSQELTEPFMERNFDKFDMEVLSRCQIFTEKFVVKHKNDLVMNYLKIDMYISRECEIYDDTWHCRSVHAIPYKLSDNIKKHIFEYL